MSDVELGHWDPYGYFPGLPASSAKLGSFPENGKIFEICDNLSLYIESKIKCRKNLHLYYQRIPDIVRLEPVVRYIIERLTTEYPESFKYEPSSYLNKLECKLTGQTLYFGATMEYVGHTSTTNEGRYRDSLDALAMQVPEDLVVQTVVEGRDKATYIHLCHANGWSAQWAIGKSFGDIHDGVKRADGNHVIKTPEKMVKHLVSMAGPIERVGAISFKTDTLLDRHPSHPKGRHLPFNPEHPRLFTRFERQTVSPIPESESFLFTIKTYAIDCKREKDKVIDSIENSSKDVYSRDFLSKHREDVLRWLKDI